MSIALGTRFTVGMEEVFSHGAYFRTIEPDNDFDLVRSKAADPQKRDKGHRRAAVGRHRPRRRP
jgi:hypothetical protein